MTVVNQDFTLYAGNTRYLRFSVTDSFGAPLDLTDAVIEWAMGPQGDKRDSVQKTSIDNGIVVVGDPVDGVFDVRLFPADTEALPFGPYDHQAEVTIDNNPQTVAVGTCDLQMNRNLS